MRNYKRKTNRQSFPLLLFCFALALQEYILRLEDYSKILSTCCKMRNYKRKTDRQSWDPQKLKQAIEAVATKQMSLRSASENFQIPLLTLARKIEAFKGGKEIQSVCEKGK